MTTATETATTTAAKIATQELLGACSSDHLAKMLLDTTHARNKAWATDSDHAYWVHYNIILHRPAAAGRTKIEWWLIEDDSLISGEPPLYGWRVKVLIKNGGRWSDDWGDQAAQGIAVGKDKARKTASRVAHSLAKQRIETPRCGYCGQSDFKMNSSGNSYCSRCGRSQ